MGSSVSSHDKHRDSQEISKTEKMQKTITQQFIPTSGNPTTQSSFSPKPLKGILKNKTNQKIEKPVKIVELYVLRGSEWSVTRVREVRMKNRWLLIKCLLNFFK